jgi:hypothetical protein
MVQKQIPQFADHDYPGIHGQVNLNSRPHLKNNPDQYPLLPIRPQTR